MYYVLCSLVCGITSFLADYSEIPYFAQGCVDSTYDDSYYSNVIRLTGSTSILGAALARVLVEYQWKQVKSICEMNFQF